MVAAKLTGSCYVFDSTERSCLSYSYVPSCTNVIEIVSMKSKTITITA